MRSGIWFLPEGLSHGAGGAEDAEQGQRGLPGRGAARPLCGRALRVCLRLPVRQQPAQSCGCLPYNQPYIPGLEAVCTICLQYVDSGLAEHEPTRESAWLNMT